MKSKFTLKLNAFFLLFIIAISSIGLPIISHACSDSKTIEFELFSAEEDDCCTTSCCHIEEETHNEIGFSKTPCCSFETTIYQNITHLVSKFEIKFTQLELVSFDFSFTEKPRLKEIHPKVFDTHFYDKYGLKYRIALQSFLC